MAASELTTLKLGPRELRGLSSLVEILEHNSGLTSLTLIANGIGALGASTLAQTLSRLSVLHLRREDIGPEGAGALARSLVFSGLVSLSVTQCQIQAPGARALGEALSLNPGLIQLDISYNTLGSEGGRAIGEALKSNSRLEYLDLTSTKIGASGMRALGEALRVNSSLAGLRLGQNEIEAGDILEVAEALKTNASLTSLDLQQNRLGSEGIGAIGQALEVNSGLRLLNLSFQGSPQDPGPIALTQALATNSTLRILDLSFTKIQDLAFRALRHHMWHNTSVTCLKLKGLPSAEKTHIKALTQRNEGNERRREDTLWGLLLSNCGSLG